MSLPKLGIPYYHLDLISGKSIQYRPFTVKEEKVLLIANESKNQRNIANAIKNVLNECILQEDPQNKILVDNMAIFDAELLFLNIRMKSVGEFSDFKYVCSECEGNPEVSVKLDLRNIEIENNSNKKNNRIMLTDSVGIELNYPTFNFMIQQSEVSENTLNNTLLALEVIKNSISAIFTGTEIYTKKDFAQEDIDNFLDSLTQEQVKKISEFYESMPRLVYNLKVECPCGVVSTKKLSGISDFF